MALGQIVPPRAPIIATDPVVVPTAARTEPRRGREANVGPTVASPAAMAGAASPEESGKVIFWVLAHFRVFRISRPRCTSSD